MKAEFKDITIYFCGPSKCEHVYDEEENILDIHGNFCGSTLVCSKCGTSAIQESLWLE